MSHLLFICAIIFISCSVHLVKDKNVEIIINEDQSYKYDLKKEVYTIYYMSNPPSEIKFNLTKEEKNKIIDTYYTLKIDKITDINKLTGNIYIEDECTTMPKFFTRLHVRTNH